MTIIPYRLRGNRTPTRISWLMEKLRASKSVKMISFVLNLICKNTGFRQLCRKRNRSLSLKSLSLQKESGTEDASISKTLMIVLSLLTKLDSIHDYFLLNIG
jgi:hypothetical protein